MSHCRIFPKREVTRDSLLEIWINLNKNCKRQSYNGEITCIFRAMLGGGGVFTMIMTSFSLFTCGSSHLRLKQELNILCLKSYTSVWLIWWTDIIAITHNSISSSQLPNMFSVPRFRGHMWVLRLLHILTNRQTYFKLLFLVLIGSNCFSCFDWLIFKKEYNLTCRLCCHILLTWM